MNRKEAEGLMGKRVGAWTAANGEYVGILVRITDDKPWRGVVRITGVIAPAAVFEVGRGYRRGFRPGEEIEVDNSSIQALPEAEYSSLMAADQSYRKALEAEAEKFKRWVREYEANPAQNHRLSFTPVALRCIEDALIREHFVEAALAGEDAELPSAINELLELYPGWELSMPAINQAWLLQSPDPDSRPMRFQRFQDAIEWVERNHTENKPPSPGM